MPDSACSLCGLPWPAHGGKPSVDTCADLLSAALDASHIHDLHDENKAVVAGFKAGHAGQKPHAV